MRARIAAATLALAGALACAGASDQKREALYGPTETIIEVVSVLRRHVPDDTYRFPPGTDFTGRNVYRASLMRLESLEVLHADSLSAGHMQAVMEFSKARALERLRAYDLAAQHYRIVAQRESVLAVEAVRSAEFCDELARAVIVGVDLPDPLDQGSPDDFGTEPAGALSIDVDVVLRALEDRVARLTALLDRSRNEGPAHYGPVVREEIERTDEVRAAYFVAVRHAIPSGPVRAVAELQRVIARHAPSKLRQRHILALADFYAVLAEEYVAAHPPESLRFDPPRFQEIVDAAAQLYQSVADEDGTPEKLVAARRFEAFLAFTLKVDRDRFSP